MRYWAPFTYLFRQPHLTTTLLVGSILFFIPIVGPIVFMGWCVLIHRALLSGSEEVPPLRFDDFSNLLSLGLGPFLVQMILGLILSFVLMPLMMLPGIGMAVIAPIMAQSGVDDSLALVVVFSVLALFVVFIFFTSFLSAMFIQAATIRAELTPEVNQAMSALNWSYLWGFVKIAKKELFLSAVVHGLISSVLVTIGMFFFYFGAFPVAVVAYAAAVHFRSQLYTIYLSRGGSPLPIQPLPGAVAPVSQGVPISYGGASPH